MEENVRELHIKENFEQIDSLRIEENYGKRIVYNNVWYNGIIYIYFSTGELKISMSCKNGLINGKYVEYYKNGNIKETGTYINGEINGKYIENFRKGNLKRETFYENSNLNGIQKEYYDKNCSIYREIEYYYGNPVNQEKIFYENGNLSALINYKNGKKNGVSEEYYESGILQNKFNYYDNELNGKYTEYYENGNLKIEGKFLNNKMEEEWVYYYENRDKEVLNFKNDVFISSSYIVDEEKKDPDVKNDGLNQIRNEKRENIQNIKTEEKQTGLETELKKTKKIKNNSYDEIREWLLSSLENMRKKENFPKEKFIEKVRNLDSEEKNRVFKAIKWHMDTYKSYFVRFDTEEIYTGNEVLEVFERLLEGVSK